MRLCSKCVKEKPSSEFNRRPNGADGLSRRCRDCTNVYARGRYSVDKKRHLAYFTKWRDGHLEYDKERKAKWYASNVQRNLDRMTVWRYETRRRAIEVLGGSCRCCGETRFSMLDIDHVQNDGAHHRSLAGGGVYKTYREMASGTVDRSRFQVLCCNCNQSKRRNGGACEHTTEPTIEAFGWCAQ